MTVNSSASGPSQHVSVSCSYRSACSRSSRRSRTRDASAAVTARAASRETTRTVADTKQDYVSVRRLRSAGKQKNEPRLPTGRGVQAGARRITAVTGAYRARQVPPPSGSGRHTGQACIVGNRATNAWIFSGVAGVV